mgnify:CR=1 FL=1
MAVRWVLARATVVLGVASESVCPAIKHRDEVVDLYSWIGVGRCRFVEWCECVGLMVARLFASEFVYSDFVGTFEVRPEVGVGLGVIVTPMPFVDVGRHDARCR